MSRMRRYGCWAVLLAGLLVIPAGTASASTKGYSLSVSTSAPTYDSQAGVAGGGQTVSVTARVVNESGTQQIGSVNLFPPSSAFDPNFQRSPDAFQLRSVVSATIVGGAALGPCGHGGTAPCFQPAAGGSTPSCTYGTFSAPCAQLRNLSLPPGGEVDVTVAVQTPTCEGSPTGTGFAWTAEVKQANNFSGPPGNDVPIDTATSSVNTAVDGACSLAFASQPADALIGKVITGTAWSTSGPPVTVQVLGQNGAQLTTFTGSVTMGLASNLGGATLSGDTSEPLNSGVATFSGLSVDVPGLYTLGASSGALTGGPSTSFTIAGTVANCQPGVSCQTSQGTAGGDQSTVSATVPSGGTSGFLAESVNVNNVQLVCSGYTSADPNTYQSFTTVAASKTITITIDNPATRLPSNPNKALKQQKICFGSTTPFVTASGQTASAGTLPDGSPGYIGLLPACSNATTGPCQSTQQSSWVPDPTRKLGYDLILVLNIPASFPGDPYHC